MLGVSPILAFGQVPFGGGHGQSRLIKRLLDDRFPLRTQSSHIDTGGVRHRLLLRSTGNPELLSVGKQVIERRLCSPV